MSLVCLAAAPTPCARNERREAGDCRRPNGRSNRSHLAGSVRGASRDRARREAPGSASSMPEHVSRHCRRSAMPQRRSTARSTPRRSMPRRPFPTNAGGSPHREVLEQVDPPLSNYRQSAGRVLSSQHTPRGRAARIQGLCAKPAGRFRGGPRSGPLSGGRGIAPVAASRPEDGARRAGARARERARKRPPKFEIL